MGKKQPSKVVEPEADTSPLASTTLGVTSIGDPPDIRNPPLGFNRADFHRNFFSTSEGTKQVDLMFLALEKAIECALLGIISIDSLNRRRDDPNVSESYDAVYNLVAAITKDPVGVHDHLCSLYDAWKESMRPSNVPEYKVPDKISRDSWKTLPVQLSIGHVAALLNTTPKNIRNMVARKQLLATLPKKGNRVNNRLIWDRDKFLAFVEEHYGHLYE